MTKEQYFKALKHLSPAQLRALKAIYDCEGHSATAKELAKKL